MDKKKIGILTFHRAENYGSVLQTYALQTYLEKTFAVNCEVIDYIPEKQKDFYELFVPVKNIKNVIGNGFKLLIARKYVLRRNSFRDFYNKYLHISKNQYVSLDDMKKLGDCYNCVVTGSDQIWNEQCADFSWAYLLDSVTGVKKISYAASMGDAIISDRNRYERCLKDYDKLSVREENAAKIIGTLVNHRKSISICVDPTLLLDRVDYEKIASPRIISGDYIFLYSVYHNDELLRTIKKYKKQLKLPLVTLISRNNSYKVLFNGMILPIKEGPNDFLSYVKYAKYVITNSFHGTVFSLIFGKEFYYLGEYENDPRIRQLLKKTEMTSVGIPYEKINEKIKQFGTCGDADYSDKIRTIRAASEEYLRHAILEE